MHDRKSTALTVNNRIIIQRYHHRTRLAHPTEYLSWPTTASNEPYNTLGQGQPLFR